MIIIFCHHDFFPDFSIFVGIRLKRSVLGWSTASTFVICHLTFVFLNWMFRKSRLVLLEVSSDSE